MASRNERRRKARQRATGRSEADHGDIGGATLVKSAGRISKAAESRQPKSTAGEEWDPERHVPPPIPPDWLWSVFETNAYHSGAINAKVADAVGRGWKLVPEDPDEEGADDDVKTVARELEEVLGAVCTKLTFRQLCEQATRELDAIGWGVWEVLRDRDGDVESEIVGILPVPAQTIRACKHSDDVFCLKRGEKKVYFKRFGFEQQVDARTGAIEGVQTAGVANVSEVAEERRANELVVFSHYSPRSSYYGIPPWVAGMPAVAEFGAIREFNVSFFDSGGQADRHVHVSAKDVDAAKVLADEVVAQLQDAAGEAHVTVVTHGADDTKVEVTPLEPKTKATTGSSRESNFRGGKSDLKEEILVAHQVPPYRVGIAAEGTLGGNAADSMDDDYRYGVVEPLQEILEAELRRTIFGDNGFAALIPGWNFEFEDKTQDEEDAVHDRTMDGVDRAVLSPNDAREATGRDRVEDPAMDRYYLSGKPISTDPAVTDVTQVLGELKDALNAAIKAGGGKIDPATDHPDSTDPGDLETAPDQVAASMAKRDDAEPAWAKRLWQAVTRQQTEHAQQPVTVELHIDKGAFEVHAPPVTFEAGAVDARTTIEKGAVEVDARTEISDGAIQAHLPAAEPVERRIQVETTTDKAGRTVPSAYVVTES